jgi:hypothetical protein
MTTEHGITVRIEHPARLRALLLTAALVSYDPGTEPWNELHDVADLIAAAQDAYKQSGE